MIAAAPSLRPLLEQLGFVHEALAAAAALRAAEQRGVLARLDAGPADAPTLARECGIGERGAGLLLAALAGLGLVEVGRDGSFQAARLDLSRLAGAFDRWEDLSDAIRTDRPTVAGDTPADAEALYPDVVGQLGAWVGDAGQRAAEHLAGANGAAARAVLDVGAGAAPWSLALAARDPLVHVTAIDLPAVLAATRRAVAAAGREAQYEFVAGDLFSVAMAGSAYDLAIAGNICHLFDAAANRRLLQRLFDALRPGGTLAILDVLPNEQLDGPRWVVLYALGLLWRTTRGQVYPFSTYATWLRDAGYEAIEPTALASGLPVTLLTARRP